MHVKLIEHLLNQDAHPYEIELPKGSIVKSVCFRCNHECLHGKDEKERAKASQISILVECPDTQEMETRKFQIIGFGQPFDNSNLKYIGAARNCMAVYEVL